MIPVDVGLCGVWWMRRWQRQGQNGLLANRALETRGRPQIALLLHYSITSYLSLQSCRPMQHATSKMLWEGQNRLHGWDLNYQAVTLTGNTQRPSNVPFLSSSQSRSRKTQGRMMQRNTQMTTMIEPSLRIQQMGRRDSFTLFFSLTFSPICDTLFITWIHWCCKSITFCSCLVM